MEFTVKEFAARERVTERTVWNWVAKGAVDIRRTPGGGVRIADRRAASRMPMLSLSDMKNPEISGNPSK
jgi:hypothetical protein